MFTKPDKPDYIDTKGIQLVRRDSCPLVKEVSTAVLDAIMHDKNTEAALDAARGAFTDSGHLDGGHNVAYFFSDGRPNLPASDVGIDAGEARVWQDFLNQHDIQSYAIGLGRDVPVKQVGSVGDFKLIPRVAKQVKLKTQTATSGDEFVRKPESSELMGLVKNKAALIKAAPSFQMEYGYARVKQAQAADFDQAMAALGSSFRFTENTAPIAALSSLPKGKIEVKQKLAQRVATMRELLACLA